MKGIRLLFGLLIFTTVAINAQITEQHEQKFGNKSWVNMICKNEVAGAPRNPPFEVQAYQYALTLPSDRGMVNRCYWQLDPESYKKLMELAKQYSDKNISVRQAIEAIKQLQYDVSQKIREEAPEKTREELDRIFEEKGLDQLTAVIYAMGNISNNFPGLESMKQLYDFLVKKGEKAELLQKDQNKK